MHTHDMTAKKQQQQFRKEENCHFINKFLKLNYIRAASSFSLKHNQISDKKQKNLFQNKKTI